MKHWRVYLQRLSAVLIMVGGGAQAVSAAPVMPQGYAPGVTPQQATPGVLQFRPAPNQAPLSYGRPAYPAAPYVQPWMGQRPQMHRPISRGSWPIPSNYMRRPMGLGYGNWQRPIAQYPGHVNPHQSPARQWRMPYSAPQYYGNRVPAYPQYQPVAPRYMPRQMAPNSYYAGPRNYRPYQSAPQPYAQSAQPRVSHQPSLAAQPYRFRPTRDMGRYQPRWPQGNRAQHQFRPLARPQSRPQPQFRQWAQRPQRNRAGYGSSSRQFPSYQRPAIEQRMSARPSYRPTMSKPRHARMAANPARPMHKPIQHRRNPVHQHHPRPFRGFGTGYRQDVKVDYRSRRYKPYRRHTGIQSPYTWRPRSRTISPYGQQFAYGASPLQ